MIQYLKRSTRRLFGFVFALSFVVAALSPATTALAYNCLPPNPHCYSIDHQPFSPPIVGDNVTLSIVALGTPNNRINNETWTTQPTGTGACVTSGFALCWLEGGYTYTAASGTEHYFTAWMSPVTGSVYTEMTGPTVGATEYGHTMSVEIRQYSTGGYYVTILPPVQSGYTNSDVSITITLSAMDIGMELAASSGGSASTAHVTQNKYITVSGGVYTAHYLTTNGTIQSNLPTAGSWNVTPSTSSTGGDFQTSCTC